MRDPHLARIETFLRDCGWAGAARTPLAEDASARRYFRLVRGAARAVLMDADPRGAERVGPFLSVGAFLRSRGYSAPDVFAADEEAGLVLLEDLGDALFARKIAAEPARESPLYRLATDFLADLHRHQPPAFVAVADGAALGALVELLEDYYLPATGAPADGAADISGLIAAFYDRLNDGAPVLALRDFHAENLIWLPDRDGVRQVGLLDFQDAIATHPAYDLVSLLQDARRDVSPEVEQVCLSAYVARKGLDQSRFSAIYTLLGAQRSLRILAVFARLSLRDGKARYLDLMPRVWRHLLRNLDHPELAELRRTVLAAVPEPTAERRSMMRAA
jgi:hypothetical protein